MRKFVDSHARFRERVDHQHPHPAVRHDHAGAGLHRADAFHGRDASWWAIICWSTSSPTRQPGAISKHLLPYTEPKRGDVIVFRYPMDIQQNYVKRVMGVPGDHIHLVNKVVYLNGHPLDRALRAAHRSAHRSISRQFSGRPGRAGVWTARGEMLRQSRGERRAGGSAGYLFRHGRQSRQFARQPLLGIRAARKHHRQAAGDLLVLRRADRGSGWTTTPTTSSIWPQTFLHQDALGPGAEADSRRSTCIVNMKPRLLTG